MSKTLLLVTLLLGTIISSLHAQKKFHICHEITADEFHAWYQAIPQVIIFDIRVDSAFILKHIPGAISVTSDSLLICISDTLDADQKIIVYDDVGNESIDACLLLASRGKSSVYHLKDGFFEWARLNFPIEDSRRKNK